MGSRSALDIGFVVCPDHGLQDEVLVCRHLALSLHEHKPREVFADDEGLNGHPEAWCGECAERVEARGGEWTDDVMEFARVRAMCARCYASVRALSSV